MNLSDVVVDSVRPEEEARFRALMQAHHYLGACPRSGRRCGMWRTCTVCGLRWQCFRAAALKCRARDAWVGWDFRTRMDGFIWSRTTPGCCSCRGGAIAISGRGCWGWTRRIVRDWPARFGIRCCCWRRSTPPGSRARCTVPRTGAWWDTPAGSGVTGMLWRGVDPEACVSLSPDPQRAPATVRREARPSAQRSSEDHA